MRHRPIVTALAVALIALAADQTNATFSFKSYNLLASDPTQQLNGTSTDSKNYFNLTAVSGTATTNTVADGTQEAEISFQRLTLTADPRVNDAGATLNSRISIEITDTTTNESGGLLIGEIGTGTVNGRSYSLSFGVSPFTPVFQVGNTRFEFLRYKDRPFYTFQGRPAYDVAGSSSQSPQIVTAVFKITPSTGNVPEPSSLALVGLGLAGLGMVARRRKG